ncbi:hypothetical protein BABINDRAFT_31609 [Babjeviella inositovora NRRL Y-12698]|uniref:Major facilitator superfamily (MFS) profile domain-containing protein n=1 Tax=Babjeviella inositovora NRRL Y-12698 TaxID=984486 RepID=A0A1E3QZI1_9ASCO|nr:uncharacterized protein BABINDRAFT_31609 [Babjeviella inositovora NRRL Y-12698]ODQ83089.1 hypothetical protein BABINDRAFT_31609 [Babjeviella inositovora NRRL Y-12698]
MSPLQSKFITAYDKPPKTYNIYVIATISTLSGLMFGFDISSVSSFVSQEHYLKFFNHPSAIAQGGITAAMSGGSFLGSLASAFTSDTLGRRISMTLCSFFWIVGAIIQSSSQNQGQLIAGRLISGIGIGYGSSAAPTYLSEISPPKVRGAIGSLFQFAVTVGIMIMFYIGYGCSFINGTGSFRVAWGIQIIPGLILMAGIPFLPESPRWLASIGHWDEAVEIITRVTGKGDASHRDVVIQLEEIKEQLIIDENASNFQYWDLFRKENIKRTSVGIFAQIWQQMCGMNVMMYYIVYIFEMAGMTGNINLVSSSIQYVINVVMTIPALLFIDKVGRRPLLLVGAVLMMTWLFASAGLLATYSQPQPNGFDGNNTVRISIPDTEGKAAKAVIACSFLFVASFAPTWGPGIWLYCSEIFPTHQRAKASALCAAFNWIFNFALSMFVPSAFRNITWKTYIVFGVMCIAMFFHVYFMFPETRGKTLEEISKMWDENIPAWKTTSYIPDMPITDDKGVHLEHKENLSGELSEELSD